jgi:hypothetical protein
MVNTRSGAGTTSDIPEQVEVNQPSATPATTPASRVVALGQSPEVYVAGSLLSRPTYPRSPSVPRNFRPAAFAFIPQPDFQSTRDHQSEDEVSPQPVQDQGPVQPNNFLSSGNMIFQAPMRPLDVARTAYLDYTKTQHIKFYNKGCEKLSGEAFNGKMLLTWLVQVRDKASMFTWITILTINGKLLTQQFADITPEEVRIHAQLYQEKATREAQNEEILIQCLKASNSRAVYNKVYLQREKYTIM